LINESMLAIREEALADKELNRRISFKEGARSITKRSRAERAEGWLEKFLKAAHGPKGGAKLLKKYNHDGFTRFEAYVLRSKFTKWEKLPAPKKGKQGRVRSVHDKRQRPKFGGVPIGPALIPKPLTLTAKEKDKVHQVAVKHGWKEKLSDETR